MLDIYRVEQRLAYLGYSAFGYNGGIPKDLTGGGLIGIPKELKVDGIFGGEEQSAVKVFNAITSFGTNPTGISSASTSINAGSENLSWLNAYNAPHWVNVYEAVGLSTSQRSHIIADFKDGTDSKMEAYSTSWVLDLVKGWQVSKPQLVALGLIDSSTKLQFNGFSDPTYQFTSHGTGAHSIGMAIDLGVHQDIWPTRQKSANNQGFQPTDTLPVGNVLGWNIDSALQYSTGQTYLSDLESNNQTRALRSFLSLYAVTQMDSDFVSRGTLGNLPLVYTTYESLFGSGLQDNHQLFQNVLIGDNVPNRYNPYTQINTILDLLGFDQAHGVRSSPWSKHHNHFHVSIRGPERIDLPDNLLAEAGTKNPYEVTDDKLQSRVQEIITRVCDELNLTSGGVDMFFMDLPDTDLQYQPVMVAQVEQAAEANPASMRTMGFCFPVPKDEYSLENVIEPKAAAANYLRSYEKLKVPFNPPAVWTILEQPKHGVLHLVTEDDRGTLFGATAGRLPPDYGMYAYLPDKDYIGDDKAVFLVELQGVKVKVVYFLQSVEGKHIGESTFDELCEKTGYRWKISSTFDSHGTATVDSVSYIEQEVGRDEQLDISGLKTWLDNLSKNGYTESRESSEESRGQTR